MHIQCFEDCQMFNANKWKLKKKGWYQMTINSKVKEWIIFWNKDENSIKFICLSLPEWLLACILLREFLLGEHPVYWVKCKIKHRKIFEKVWLERSKQSALLCESWGGGGSVGWLMLFIYLAASCTYKETSRWRT